MGCASAIGCAAMILKISTSGGFAGLSTAPVAVEVDDLPGPVQAQVCETFTPEGLADWARASGDAAKATADMLTYRIEVIEDGETRDYAVHEAALDAEVLDLIDVLLHPPAKD